MSSTDCKLIRSSCGCHAVHVDDPRSEITSCTLGGCETCTENHCDPEHVVARCIDGQCLERRGDPEGTQCEMLDSEQLASTVQSSGWIRELRATPYQGGAVAVWTAPEEAIWRYGHIEAARVDFDGQLVHSIATFGGTSGRSSNPSVSADGAGPGLTWVTENSDPAVYFQRLGGGVPAGQPIEITPRADEAVGPRLIGRDEGFDLFWVRQDWDEDDGFYHVQLHSSGQPIGAVDYQPWLVTSLVDFAVIKNRGRFAIAWDSDIHDLPGLYLSNFPLSSQPVRLLADEGTDIDMASSGLGFAVVWRDPQASGGFVPVYLQAFDQDSNPTSPPVWLGQQRPALYGPEVMYLGGVYLVTWFAFDSHMQGEPRKLMSVQVTETGRKLQTMEQLGTVPDGALEQFHSRSGDRILTGVVHAGANSDTLHFLRWACQ